MPSSIQLVRLREREEREERERRGDLQSHFERVGKQGKHKVRCALPAWRACLPALIWNDGGGVTGCDNQQDCVFDASSDLVKTAQNNVLGLRITCFADSAMDGLVSCDCYASAFQKSRPKITPASLSLTRGHEGHLQKGSAWTLRACKSPPSPVLCTPPLCTR